MRSILATKFPHAPMAEALEGRTHFSVSTWLASSVSSLSDYTYTGVVEVGDPWGGGPPSIILGTTNGSSVSSADAGWQWNDDGSFDVGASVKVTADPSGQNTVSMAVGNVGTISIPSSTTSFSQVAIQAAVYGDGKMATWSNVVVDFYRNGGVAEEYTVGSLVANTFDATDGGNQEAVAVVSATGGPCTKVVVSGSLRLQAQPGTYPGADEIIGKIAIS